MEIGGRGGGREKKEMEEKESGNRRFYSAVLALLQEVDTK